LLAEKPFGDGQMGEITHFRDRPLPRKARIEMFSPKIRLILIFGCVGFGLYKLNSGEDGGGLLLLAAAILAIGHFRSTGG